MTNSERIYKVIARVMDVPISRINDESSPQNIESWDSFNGLVLADELESEFNLKFTMKEIEEVVSVADIKKHLKNHGVKFDD